MDIKEKLRLAALKAETDAVGLIPPDTEIDWTPSATFISKMDEIVELKPKRRLFTIKRFIIAAAVVALISSVLVPVFMRPDTSDGANTEGNNPYYDSGTISDDKLLNDGLKGDISELVGESVSVPPPSSAPDIPYSPSYIPKGYTLTDCEADSYITALVYSNGSDIIRLYFYEGETDFSILEDRKDDLDDGIYYNNVPQTHTVEKDPSTDALIEYILFPDEVEWNQNNVAWNGTDMTFTVMGNENISEEELEKIAESVNLEPKE